jgi:hypothetical protein
MRDPRILPVADPGEALLALGADTRRRQPNSFAVKTGRGFGILASGGRQPLVSSDRRAGRPRNRGLTLSARQDFPETSRTSPDHARPLSVSRHRDMVHRLCEIAFGPVGFPCFRLSVPQGPRKLGNSEHHAAPRLAPIDRSTPGGCRTGRIPVCFDNPTSTTTRAGSSRSAPASSGCGLSAAKIGGRSRLLEQAAAASSKIRYGQQTRDGEPFSGPSPHPGRRGGKCGRGTGARNARCWSSRACRRSRARTCSSGIWVVAIRGSVEVGRDSGGRMVGSCRLGAALPGAGRSTPSHHSSYVHYPDLVPLD